MVAVTDSNFHFSQMWHNGTNIGDGRHLFFSTSCRGVSHSPVRRSSSSNYKFISFGPHENHDEHHNSNTGNFNGWEDNCANKDENYYDNDYRGG
ncbi:hypothetical protein G9C98_003584 [Cotesia typhae]|uniref:Uncharacterized protein n=1 Tax=Cotesia typhae TaxID=2053667 RepID=A0A8J5R330_9HYME|nr:hypothetical protein G9C98_003584 [Cotesia typhae]